MSDSGKTGFYLRVLKEGYVQEDSNLELLKYADNETLLSVFDLNEIYYTDNKNIERLAYAIKNPYLTEERISKLERFLTRAKKANNN